MKPFPLFLAVLCLLTASRSVHGQENNPLINSGNLLEEGGRLYDSGEYRKAIAVFSRIDRNDTNYCKSLNALSLSCYSDSQYVRSVQYSEAALREVSQAPELEPDILNNYGNALDGVGKSTEALAVFDSAIAKYPSYALLYMNKGTALLRMKRNKEAEAVFQQGILIDPYSYSGHLKLAVVALRQGKIVPALFGLTTYLMLNPEGSSHQACITLLSSIAKNKDDIQKYVNERTEAPTGNYELLEQILQSKIALDPAYKPITKLDDVIARQIQVIFEKMELSDDEKDFYAQYYIPFYKSVFTGGKFELLINRIFMTANLPVIQDYLKRNKKEMKEFIADGVAYFDQIIQTRVLSYAKRQTAPVNWHFAKGKLIGQGMAINNGDKLIGPWKFLYRYGNVKSEGLYDSSGNRQGTWTYYYFNGKLQGREYYKDGKQEGEETYYSTAGLLSHHALYKANELDGEYISYYYEGDPHIVMQYRAGKEEGEKTYYFGTGHASASYTFKAGLKDGIAKGWYEDGAPEYTCSYKDDKLDGPYQKYFENGKLASEGAYLNDKSTGKWTYYHPNGRVRLEETLIDGNADGPYKEYFDNGQVSTVSNYKKGKLTGQQQLFDEDGKQYAEFLYENDKIKSAKYLNKNGQVIAQTESKGKGMELTVYGPQGNKEALMNYDPKGDLIGPKISYYASGAISNSEQYAGGVLEGQSISYYPNGNKKEETAYESGEKNGYTKAYYQHGQVKAEGWYAHDQAQGNWLYYDELGALTDSIYYLNGDMTGYRSQFLPNGKKEYELKYRLGTLEGNTQWDSTGKMLCVSALPAGSGKYKLMHANGAVSMDATYASGNLDGARTSYYYDGKPLVREYYRHGLQDSVTRSYFHSGKMSHEGRYRLGNKEGVWSYFGPDGKLTRTVEYKGGTQNGKETLLSVDGKPELETNFVDDEKDGPQKRYDGQGNLAYQLNYSKGELRSYTYPDKNGKLVESIPVVSQTGKIRTYYANGTVSAELEFKDGYQTGAFVQNYPDGKPMMMYNRVLGMDEGPYKAYYPNGKPRSEYLYLHDNLHGPYKLYNREGVCIEEGHFYNGNVHGVVKRYDDKGALIETSLYYYGTLLSAKS